MKKIVLSMLLMLSVEGVYAQTTASFQVQATIENGCELSNAEQLIDFGRHPVASQDKHMWGGVNTAQSWNIRCTSQLPVKIMLNAGDSFSNSSRHMKHSQKNEFVPYQLYQDSNLQNEYVSGNAYSLTPTTALNPLLNFSVFGLANLDNNNQPRSVGLYKDSVAITITW
jgi:spore coat protein U-like protein